MRIAAEPSRTVGGARPVAPAPENGAGPGAGGASEDPVDRLLSALVSPDPAGPARPASRAPVLAGAIERIALLVKSGAAPAVTVQLGRSLDVRITQAPAGVEVALQVVRGLSPLAEAELPILVAALRARGVRVSRADVQARQGRGGRR
ncbi:MAG: hypothetical protein WB493_15345 [Anaeromyxobacteraceae bacterium]